jgi:alpha-tubulin suppressor-like RCC1 family protein
MMVYGATAIVDVPENASGGTYQMKVKVKDSEGGERIFVREVKMTKEVKEGESVCVPSEEICDGLDNDCNELIDDGVKLVFYKDLDGDEYTDGTTSVGCSAPQGYVLSALLGDCNDENNQINPGKTEICDGIDNNCNGQIDEGVKLVFYKDLDGDGYTDGTTQVVCTAPQGYVLSATSGDCNDNDPNVNPGKTEICDGKDNNCNGQIDEGVLLVFYKDKDGDGYGDVNDQTLACVQPTGYVSNSSDCNDNDPNVNPGKSELCDGKDNNCNGQTDEGFNVGQSCTVGIGECARTGQFVCKADGSGTQCNATPGTPTTEICDGKDNDCDGQIDEDNVCFFFASKVAAGYAHTCAIKQDGSLWCWGDNMYGQLGTGAFGGSVSIPVQIMPSGVSFVAAGDYHTCAVKTDGSLWCWGYNGSGQLGNGTFSNSSTPVQIMSSGVVAVALGGAHTCVIKTDGSLWCWGNNDHGQIGNGYYGYNISTPVQIMSSGVHSVALGYAHTCVVKMDGSLWCWGYNYYGQVGNGTSGFDRFSPDLIMLSGVASVSLGRNHTCATKTNNTLWCWGSDYYGQLGDGTNTSKNTPVQIMSSGVVVVALEYAHTCAIKQDGSLWCWGWNDYGQLGDGTNANKDTPTYIMNLGSGGGGTPPIGDKSSFGNTEQKQARYGCSSANIVFYMLHLIFPALILFALLKSRFFVRN